MASLAACAQRPPPPPTVDELVHDRVELDGIVLKCNSNLKLTMTDPACANARAAIDRISAARDAREAARREAEFERRREELRLAALQQQLEKQEADKVDAYALPIVPVEPRNAPSPMPTQRVSAARPVTAKRAGPPDGVSAP